MVYIWNINELVHLKHSSLKSNSHGKQIHTMKTPICTNTTITRNIVLMALSKSHRLLELNSENYVCIIYITSYVTIMMMHPLFSVSYGVIIIEMSGNNISSSINSTTNY